MADRAQIVQLVDALHAARMNGQLDDLCQHFKADAKFRVAGSSAGKPIAISVQGVAEIRPWLAIMVKTFRLSEYQRVSLVIDACQAAVHWKANIHSKITGLTVPTELVDVLQISEARIESYLEFFVPS